MNKCTALCMLLVMSIGSGSYAIDDGFDGFNNGKNDKVFSEGMKELKRLWNAMPKLEEVKDGFQKLKEFSHKNIPSTDERLISKSVTEPSVQPTTPSVILTSEVTPEVLTQPANTINSMPPVHTPVVQTTDNGFFNISKNTLLLSGVTLATLAGITYILHKKGVLKKIKQKIEGHPRIAVGIAASLAAIGGGSYYYFVNE